MRTQINQVLQFNEAFNLPTSDTPILISVKQQELRVRLLLEEVQEYATANASGDLVEVTDAAADILYLAFGLVIEHGLQHIIEDVFDSVHFSNLSKLDDNGKPVYREDGKVIKGPNFFTPTYNINKLLEVK